MGDLSTPPRRRATLRRRRRQVTSSFFLIYLRRELLRRRRQVVTNALGLAVGVGLVVIIAATTAGVGDAQNTVLRSLYGIGTDLTVTTAANASGSARGSSAQTPGSLQPGDLSVLRSSYVAVIARLPGVVRAVGGLDLTEIKQSRNALPASVPVDGLDLPHPHAGPFGSGALTSGRSFTAADGTANVAVVDARYAAADHIKVGSQITVGGAIFRVIGTTRQASGGTGADIYIPLGRAQALTHYRGLKHLTGRVDIIYVTASSAALVAAVQREIAQLLPGVTLTSSADLASAIHGSLTSTAKLADGLGRWVAIAALITACAITSVLTVAAVTRRTREIGTLRALGWRSRRIVTQIMSESVVAGAIGAVIGVAIGFAGVTIVNSIAPELTTSAAGPLGAPGGTHIAVRLTAHVGIGITVLAIGLSIGGALIAGFLGARRATRFQPADAFAQVS